MGGISEEIAISLMRRLTILGWGGLGVDLAVFLGLEGAVSVEWKVKPWGWMSRWMMKGW